MAFVMFNAKPMKTREEIALEVHQVSLARGLDELATVICLMGISTEVGTGSGDNRRWWCPWNPAVQESRNYPFDSESNDSRSMGYLQQQPGPNGEPWWGTTESMMTLSTAADQFLARLSDNYTTAANNPALAGQFAQQVQGSAFPDRYAANWQEAWDVLNAALAAQPPAPVQPPAPAPAPTPEPVQPPQEAPVAERPDFNEYPKPCTNFQSRAGTKVDLFILHTEEGNSNADQLANFLISTEGGPNPVSYHYTISKGATDDGVTVCDVVDTDNASWSVMASNNRSINLCFAGSSVNWDRNTWMANERALDVAAYIAVRDCNKYGVDIKMLVDLDAHGMPQYLANPPGIADHRYCTEWLKDGNTHDDVGDNFPWDYFAQRVSYWAAAASAPAPAPAPEPAPAPDPFQSFLSTASDHDLLVYIASQLGPGDPTWASKGSTLRDKVWSLPNA